MFNYSGDTIITGSKDNTCKIWRDEGAIGWDKDVIDTTDEGTMASSGYGGLGGNGV
jgi:hypothetical protein